MQLHILVIEEPLIVWHNGRHDGGCGAASEKALAVTIRLLSVDTLNFKRPREPDPQTF